MLKSVANPLFMRKTTVDKLVENLWINRVVVHNIHRTEIWQNLGVDKWRVIHKLSTGKIQVIHQKTGVVHKILWITFLLHKHVYFALIYTYQRHF